MVWPITKIETVVNLKQNYFELFGLPVSFELDIPALTPIYRDLQKQYHPDRFADADSATQRSAVQFASFINEALETLKNPVKRAMYLLQLAGHSVSIEQTTVADTDFLMGQMELREELEEAETFEQLDALKKEVGEWLASLSREFVIDYAEKDFSEAADTVRKMQFMSRFLDEVRVVEERMEDEEFDE